MTQKFYKRVFAEKVEYKGIKFNSKLEADFAMFLDGKVISYKGVKYYHKPIEWTYEQNQFVLIPQETWVDRTEKDTTVKTIKRNKKHILPEIIYTPDFYLPQYNLFIETKGYQFDDELFSLRFRLFKHRFPDVKILKITSHTDFDKLDTVLENLKLEGN